MRVSSPLLRTALPAPLRPLSRASLAPPPHAPAAPHRLASRLTPSAYTGTRRHAEAPADDEAPAPTADLTTTDPLEHYLAAVARGEVRRDEEQIRVMAKLRDLTRRLSDYTPPAHLLSHLSRRAASPASSTPSAAARGGAVDASQVRELVAYLSEAQTLASLDTPRGILLTGPPGRGKTMCLDAWYEALPVRGKFRRHYHHLLLTIYRLIWAEAERRRQLRNTAVPFLSSSASSGDSTSSGPRSPQRGTGTVWQRASAATTSEADDTLRSGTGQLWKRALKGMPFYRPDAMSGKGGNAGSDLDEPLPPGAPLQDGQGTERSLALHAAATLFLQHGHVLLFDELQLVDVTSASLLRQILTAYWFLGGVLVGSSNRLPEDLFANHVQRRALTEFLMALRERCEVVEMGGQRDWRRKGEEEEEEEEEKGEMYFVQGEKGFEEACEKLVAGREGKAASVTVYGRRVLIPLSYAARGSAAPVCRFTFAQLCDVPLGPADYLTLASSYRTFILDDVPQLPLSHKNQARRLITLLDALYEAGCALLVRAAAPPDGLFFPNERREAGEGALELLDSQSMMQSETMSEALQDTEEGFRPNVGRYREEQETQAQSDAAAAAAAATASATAAAQGEEQAKPQRRRMPGEESEKSERRRKEGRNEGFMSLAIFSGEDERFSFQRAVSRLHEMSRPTWRTRPWRPFLDVEMSQWGSGADAALRMPLSKVPLPPTPHAHREANQFGMAEFGDEASFAGPTTPLGATVFEPEPPNSPAKRRASQDGAPVLSAVHAWGMAEWGPKAGRWGRGARAEEEQEEEREEETPRERRRRLSEQRRRQEGAE